MKKLTALTICRNRNDRILQKDEMINLRGGASYTCPFCGATTYGTEKDFQCTLSDAEGNVLLCKSIPAINREVAETTFAATYHNFITSGRSYTCITTEPSGDGYLYI